jgi:hypothetical protein
MNFKQWFDSQTKIGYPCYIDYLSAQKGWDAAKDEIIKILDNNLYSDDCVHNFDGIKKEIKNL